MFLHKEPFGYRVAHQEYFKTYCQIKKNKKKKTDCINKVFLFILRRLLLYL